MRRNELRSLTEEFYFALRYCIFGFPWLQSWNCYGASILPPLDPFFFVLSFLSTSIWLVHSLGIFAFFLFPCIFASSTGFSVAWAIFLLLLDFLEIIPLLMIPIFTLY